MLQRPSLLLGCGARPAHTATTALAQAALGVPLSPGLLLLPCDLPTQVFKGNRVRLGDLGCSGDQIASIPSLS